MKKMTVFILIIILAAAAIVKVAPKEDDTPVTWQEAFAALLMENYGEYRKRFMLYDINMDGLPEMFVSDDIDDTITVYAFRGGVVIAIEPWDETSLLHLFRGAARTWLMPAPEGVPGLVFGFRGASSGWFGTSVFYSRVLIEGDALVIADEGKIYIDVTTLHELFADSGWSAEADAIIQEHTHIILNGETVTEEDFRSVFGQDLLQHDQHFGPRLHEVNEDNIRDIIFGYSNP